MTALLPSRPSRVRTAVAAGIAVLVVAAFVFTYGYHRAMRRIDRRIAHSALYAARPRPRAVASRLRSPSAYLLRTDVSVRPQHRLQAYEALQPNLIAAVTATEDRQFFTHSGINYLRTAKCAVQDAFSGQIACGGSTLTQQLARAYFLSQHKTLQRKVEEILIARRLEQRLTKQQIFVMYTGAVSFGQNDGIAVRGFQQAAHVFFGKDLSRLDLAQDALLAGMVHAPNFDNPFRHPERALHRRNVVLDSMVETGALTRADAEVTKAEPLQTILASTTVYTPPRFVPAVD